MSYIEWVDLLDVTSMKPMLDGKQLCKVLGEKPGPWMKPALDILLQYQLRNPEETEAGEAIEEVRRERKRLKVG